ncbi:MAG: hypothetical protein IIT97_02890, partial [Mycoplasmataceae bacterium]|nr:hypothetical protein [Mycoplasmataceae bacterium]
LNQQPANLPETVTYVFGTGSIICANLNGWSKSIPEVDEENNNLTKQNQVEQTTDDELPDWMNDLEL